jgi:hypothetical protein
MTRYCLYLLFSLLIVSAHAQVPQQPKQQPVQTKQEQKKEPLKKSEHQQKAHEDNDGGDEYWPPLWGYKLKVTDTLLVVFTCLLFFATLALWWATKRLVNGARKTAEEELRAYIVAESVSVVPLRDPPNFGVNGIVINGRIRKYRVAVVLKNGGKTPTRYARCEVNSQRIRGAIPAGFDFPDSGIAETMLIGPGAEAFTRGITFNAGDVDATAGTDENYYVWGWIDYNDVFTDSARHRTEFCFKISADNQHGGETYLTFNPHERFFAADSDCMRKPTALDQ